MHIRRALRLGTLGLIIVTGACKYDTDEISAVAPMSENDSDELQGNELDLKVSSAVRDLSARTGIAVDAITVTSASHVNWGSSAVGCPRDGMNYTQAIVPGVLVLLEADGTVHRYHGGEKGELFHCPTDRAEAPAYGSGTEFM